MKLEENKDRWAKGDYLGSSIEETAMLNVAEAAKAEVLVQLIQLTNEDIEAYESM